MQSARPVANFAIIFADAGQITNSDFFFNASRCVILPNSTSVEIIGASANVSTDHVVTNLSALLESIGVMLKYLIFLSKRITSNDLYALMLPLIPKMTSL